MKMFSYIEKQLELLCASCLSRIRWFHQNIFSLELLYFLFISSLGFLVLHSLDGRTTDFAPRKLDMFFTSVSATTTSSMSTVEMEVFSNTQLIILTFLMFMGGEVFTSMVTHYTRTVFVNISPKDRNTVDCFTFDQDTQCNVLDDVELNDIKILEFGGSKSNGFSSESCSTTHNHSEVLKYKSLRFLGVVVLFYLGFVQILGVVSVWIYLHVISSAKDILNDKGLEYLTFTIFTVVSTFANCGFLPTNENMLIFRKNSGLLLILIPQVLLGTTLYPPVLRFLIWAIGKITKKPETSYLLNNSKNIGYHHLFSYQQSFFLSITVLVFITVQFVLFSSMEWSSSSLAGLNVYQKLVAILFQIINTRYAGEPVVDLSTISGAVLVLFVLMMYLPPYTSFLPVTEKGCEEGSKKSKRMMENLLFSPQIYLIIFIILVCITERKQMVDDPLNFNVFNIVIEVISAYGNVGLSIGYHCDRRLKRGSCQNKTYGFSGTWSDEGKLVLIAVMIFGKLKKFNMNGGNAWKIL